MKSLNGDIDNQAEFEDPSSMEDSFKSRVSYETNNTPCIKKDDSSYDFETPNLLIDHLQKR